MATRALIGYLSEDREFTCTYNHYDGNPEYLGKILLDHFDNDADVKSKIVDILKGNDAKPNKWKSIRQAVADSRLQDFTELYTFLYEKVDEYGGNYGYVWFSGDGGGYWMTLKNSGIRSMADQFEKEMPADAGGVFRVDENKEKNIMEEGYEAKWANFLNEAQEMDFSVIKKFIQDDLQRGDQKDPALDAYIESLQRDFAAGREDAYSDYEMDDYVEDFQNYEADKMDS